MLNNETFRTRNIPPYLCREYFKSQPALVVVKSTLEERKRERERERVQPVRQRRISRLHAGLHARDNFDRRIGWYINDWPTRRFFLASSRVISRNIVANQLGEHWLVDEQRICWMQSERSFYLRRCCLFLLKMLNCIFYQTIFYANERNLGRETGWRGRERHDRCL